MQTCWSTSGPYKGSQDCSVFHHKYPRIEAEYIHEKGDRMREFLVDAFSKIDIELLHAEASIPTLIPGPFGTSVPSSFS